MQQEIAPGVPETGRHYVNFFETGEIIRCDGWVAAKAIIRLRFPDMFLAARHDVLELPKTEIEALRIDDRVKGCYERFFFTKNCDDPVGSVDDLSGAAAYDERKTERELLQLAEVTELLEDDEEPL